MTTKKLTKKLTEEELKERVVELAKKGLTSEKIGEVLRQEGTHTKEYSLKISKILKEKNLYENPDLKNLTQKIEKIKTHYAKNKQDKRSMREKDRIFSQIRKHKKYLKIN